METQMGGGPPPPSARTGEAEATARFLEAIASRVFGIAPQLLRDPGRGCASVALTRQVAMYLAHTRLRLSYAAAGDLFGRDRTTAAHACECIEERREAPPFDAALERLEKAVDAWAELAVAGVAT